MITVTSTVKMGMKSRRVAWEGHITRIGNAYKILVGKLEGKGKKPAERPRRR
jgi:hypothetical protein